MPKTLIQMTPAERRKAQGARRALREVHDALVGRAVDAFLARHPEWAGAPPATDAERNRAVDTLCNEFFAAPPVSGRDHDVQAVALAWPSEAQRADAEEEDIAEAALGYVYGGMWEAILSRWGAPAAPSTKRRPVVAGAKS